jgi:hypothetical protein
MKNDVFWDVTPCGSSKNRRFEETCPVFFDLLMHVILHCVKLWGNVWRMYIYIKYRLDHLWRMVSSGLLRRVAFFIVTAVKTSNLTWTICILVCSPNVQIRIYTTIILPVVLYGGGTWYLTLREEHRLSLFEKLVLRIIFGVKRNEAAEGRRKLQSECSDLSSTSRIIRIIKSSRMWWAGHVARMCRSVTCIGYW